MASPGPGKGCLHTSSGAIPKAIPSSLTSSLKSSRKGSISCNFMDAGSPPTLWWVLIVAEGPL